ncbi:MAG TPA: helix-turn-helix domain-containing protein [Vicinamibacterales bacterium]|nr:helix-turn-helix domain-containing protein [Vicinamibacterales bacterium]
MIAIEPAHATAAWTFFTNHAYVLMCLSRDPEARIRDVAQRIGITERAVQRIVAELEQHAYLRRIREGRRNRYEVRMDLPLRHQMERHCHVSDLLVFADAAEPAESATGRARAAEPQTPSLGISPAERVAQPSQQ